MPSLNAKKTPLALALVLALLQSSLETVARPAESVGTEAIDASPTGSAIGGQLPISSEIRWESHVSARTRNRPDGAINVSLADEELARWNMGGNSDAGYIANRRTYHPGTRVIIDVQLPPSGTSARSSASRYLADIRNRGYWPYRICFETALNQPPNKGVDTFIRVAINRKGQITRTRLVQTTTKERGLGECLLQATRSITLHSTIATAGLTLRIRLHPGDAPLSAYEDVTTGGPTIELATAENAQPVKIGVESCIRAGLERDHFLWGRLELRIVLDAEGAPVHVSEHRSHFPDPTAVACTLAAVGALRFPNIHHPGPAKLAFRVGRPPGERPSEDRLWVDPDSNRGPTD